MTIPQSTRVCLSCHITKPTSDFDRQLRKDGTLRGYHRRCRECRHVAFEPIPGEEWRPVVGFEGLYEVSDLGRVRRSGAGKGARPGSILKTQENASGYMAVRLSRNKRAFTCTVHSLVAPAFLGPRPEGYDINHKDFDRHNPLPSNLEYLTRRENMLHSRSQGRLRGGSFPGEKNPRAKLTGAQVAEIRRDYRPRVVTLATLAARYGVSINAISMIVNRQSWGGC